MRSAWELLRAMWAAGCIPIGALLLIVLVLCGFDLAFFLGTSGEADPVVRWLFWALVLYFVGGVWLFSWVDLTCPTHAAQPQARIETARARV